MKQHLTLALVVALFSIGYGQPKITNVSFPKSVETYGLFEMAFQMGDYANPYDPAVIDVYAEFLSPEGKSVRVNGFYYEGYGFEESKGYEQAKANRDRGWRVRFAPEVDGDWTFSLHAIDRQGKTELSAIGQNRFGFQCQPARSAKGFISLANRRFLKRDVVANGQRESRAFFPIGPNIAWYGNGGSYAQPKGIYDYEKYVDSIAGSANYMRIWINRPQCLSLFGAEYTQTSDNKATVYFNSTLNQKDAAELDHIMAYAAKNGISVMPCIFTFGSFCSQRQSASTWENNPFHTVLGLASPTDFFTDSEAKRITRNLIRYIVARWGYATNIVCWELWNEVDNISNGQLPKSEHQRNVVGWHGEMAQYIRDIDPFHHPITTSLAVFNESDYFHSQLFDQLDIVQKHSYGSFLKAKEKDQRPFQLYKASTAAFEVYPNKPFFIGEFGISQSTGKPKYKDKDPLGFDTHNCIWSTAFSGAMGPASFWYWECLDEQDLFRIYEPLLRFCEGLPPLSDSFAGRCTAKSGAANFPNGIQTFYMANATEDTIYGWSQDANFSYPALRRLTEQTSLNGQFNGNVFDPKGYVYTLDVTKKPEPSSKNNTIKLPVSNQAAGTQYIVRWYDTETGLEMKAERTTVKVNGKSLSFEFPSSVRDLKNKRINNTYGDAVFSLTVDRGTKEESGTQGAAPKKVVIRPAKSGQD